MKALFFSEATTCNTFRIARDSLVNNDNATIFNNISQLFGIWRASLSLGNREETLKPSSLPTKNLLVSSYSYYFDNLFILQQMSEGKTKKREFIV